MMDQTIAENILIEEYDENEYEPVTEADVTGTSRWNTYYEQVFKHRPTETYWMFSWYMGSTEYQDNGVEGVSFYQVEPHEMTITVYRSI